MQRAVLLLVDELYPDDLFSELVDNLDRVPRRQSPRVLAIVAALPHGWRRDGLVFTGARMATQTKQVLDPESTFAIRLTRRLVPVTNVYHGR